MHEIIINMLSLFSCTKLQQINWYDQCQNNVYYLYLLSNMFNYFKALLIFWVNLTSMLKIVINIFSIKLWISLHNIQFCSVYYHS